MKSNEVVEVEIPIFELNFFFDVRAQEWEILSKNTNDTDIFLFDGNLYLTLKQ